MSLLQANRNVVILRCGRRKQLLPVPRTSLPCPYRGCGPARGGTACSSNKDGKEPPLQTDPNTILLAMGGERESSVKGSRASVACAEGLTPQLPPKRPHMRLWSAMAHKHQPCTLLLALPFATHAYTACMLSGLLASPPRDQLAGAHCRYVLTYPHAALVLAGAATVTYPDLADSLEVCHPADGL